MKLHKLERGDPLGYVLWWDIMDTFDDSLWLSVTDDIKEEVWDVFEVLEETSQIRKYIWDSINEVD